MTALPQDPHVGLVVEGAGDVLALPILLRAHLIGVGEYRDVVGKPVPLHGRTKAVAQGGVEGYVAVAAARPGCVGVAVILDADSDCPAELAPGLRRRAEAVAPVPVRVCLAERDVEDWLFASAETLGIDHLVHEPDRRGLHEIKRALRPQTYTKPVWQPRLMARVDVGVARSRSVSLDRFLHRFDELRAALPPAG